MKGKDCLFRHDKKDQASGKGQGKDSKPCRFFNTPGGCMKGKDCLFKHEPKKEGGKPKSPAPKQGGKGGGKGNAQGRSKSRDKISPYAFCRLHLRPGGAPLTRANIPTCRKNGLTN